MRALLAAMLPFALLAPLAAAERLLAVPGTAMQVAMPADWRESPARGAALAVHQPGGTAGLAVTVAPLASGTGPAAFARSAFAELLDLGDAVTVLEHHFSYPIGVRTWSQVRYHLRIGPVVWEQILWMTVDDGSGICVTGSADPADFARWLPVFERAVAAASLGRAELAR